MMTINTNITPTFDKKIIGSGVLVSILFLAISLIFASLNFLHLPPEIPIFYSTKTQILAGKIAIFIMPGIIFLTLVLNFAISKVFWSKSQFLAKILVLTTAVVSFLVFFGQLKIILLF